ncbi:MAG: hypothetical protein J1E96_06860 [Ruminococcus sp.]|nr:hypothetical protein [Ruminococcus sp.]
MKRFGAIISLIIMCVLVGGAFPLTAYAQNTSYELDELNMSVAVPNDMLAITRESEKTDSYFSKFGVDYEETMNNLEESNIYLYALKEDNSLSLTVTMAENDESKKIDSYSKISDEELSKIKDELLGDKSYKTANIVEVNGTKYILLTMSTKSGKKIIQAQQYNTVINGENIIITMQSAAGKKLTADNKELFTSVIEGTSIIEVTFLSQHGDLIISISATVIGLIIVVVALILLLRYLRNPERRHKILVHELAHEHRITDTTRIPRKTIFSITKPTQSFLENYDPIEEIGTKSKKRRKTSAAKAQTDAVTSETVRENTLQSLDEILPAEIALQNTPRADEISAEDDLDRAVSAAIEAAQENHSGTETDVHNVQEDFEEEEATSAQDVSYVAPAVSEDVGDNAASYFDDDADENNLYSNSAFEEIYDEVSDYDYENEDNMPSQNFSDNASRSLSKVGAVLLTIGKFIAKIFVTIGMVLLYIIVHLRYFCINLYRLIKRKYKMRKRRKIEEERRRQQSERRRIERETERARQLRNASRGENDLVKVHSQGERRPANRNARPQQRVAYPRSQSQNRRPRR